MHHIIRYRSHLTHQKGRDVIEVAADSRRLLDTAHRISTVDLTVTMRRAFDTFREHMAAVIIEWLLDLLQCHVAGDTSVLKDIIASEIFLPRRRDTCFLYQEVSLIYPEAHEGARLDWLFVYHPRLWKRPRLNLKQIYITILTMGQDNRLAVGMFFASFILTVLTAPS